MHVGKRLARDLKNRLELTKTVSGRSVVRLRPRQEIVLGLLSLFVVDRESASSDLYHFYTVFLE